MLFIDFDNIKAYSDVQECRNSQRIGVDMFGKLSFSILQVERIPDPLRFIVVRLLGLIFCESIVRNI